MSEHEKPAMRLAMRLSPAAAAALLRVVKKSSPAFGRDPHFIIWLRRRAHMEV